MRFMVMVKATKESEAGVPPSTELLTAMGKFNEEMVKAGVMLAGEGLQPSSKGARVRFSGEKRTVIDGPFTETKELIAGFWMIQVKSKDEVIEWVKRCPNPFDGESEIEIRQVFEAADFGDNLTPELREQEERLRARSRRQTGVKQARTKESGDLDVPGGPRWLAGRSRRSLAAVIDATWIFLVLASSVPMTFTFSRRFLRRPLVAQVVDVLPGQENVGVAVDADAGDGAFGVGRAHAHRGVPAVGAGVVGDDR